MEFFYSRKRTEKVFFWQLQMLPHTLTRVRQQLEYRIDVCRVTRGAHIEHL